MSYRKRIIYILTLFILFIATRSYSQIKLNSSEVSTLLTSPYTLNYENKLKLYSRSTGLLIGIQKGKYTFFEIGAEKHWKTIRLIKPRMYSVSLHTEYSFKENLAGYKLGFWTRQGRMDFTFGGYINYLTDFHNYSLGFAPSIGFRLLNFHLLNGYNFNIIGDGLTNYNKLYFSLRYYIPLKNKLKMRNKK